MRVPRPVRTDGLGLCAAALAAALVTPTQALAIDAFDILIPKPAEFFPALAAFIVIWVILAKLIWPSVLKTLDARQQTIQDNLDAAEQSKLDARRALKKSETTIDEAQQEADRIVREAREQAEVSRTNIIAKANDEAKRIIERSQQTVEAERQAALVNLTDEVADISVDLAGRIIGENLDKNTQKRLIERYLAKAGDLDGE